MMTFEEVKGLFAELREQQGIEGLEFDESESATVPVGDAGMVLHVQYRRDVGDVVLLAPLGELPDASAAYVLEALLAANLYWQGTVGCTIAWNVELEQPILQYAVPETSLTPVGMAATLANFLTVAGNWRANVAALAANEPLSPEPDENEDPEPESPAADENFIAV